MFVHITVHYRLRGITSTIAIAIGPRHLYNVIYKGAKNKTVVQKKMILNTIFFMKMIYDMNRTTSRTA